MDGVSDASATQDEPSRDSLVNRELPEMTLSKGDEISNTAPPVPTPHYLDATGRALFRFEVEGRAVGVFSSFFPCQVRVLFGGLVRFPSFNQLAVAFLSFIFLISLVEISSCPAFQVPFGQLYPQKIVLILCRLH